MPNTLGLDDDLDPVDAVVRLEKAFALKISDDEAVSCRTVGDIYDLLQSRFSARIGEPGSCMTSMAFYRLRRSLREMHPGVEFRPGTLLANYVGGSVRIFLKQLRSDTGLQLPERQGGRSTGIGWLLILSAFFGALIIALSRAPAIFYFAGLILFVTGTASIKFDPGILPGDCATLGGFVTKASALNYGSLAGSGGAVRPKDLWDAMAEVLSGLGGLAKSEMRRDTLILGSRTP